jgi:hypothetical protein
MPELLLEIVPFGHVPHAVTDIFVFAQEHTLSS